PPIKTATQPVDVNILCDDSEIAAACQNFDGTRRSRCTDWRKFDVIVAPSFIQKNKIVQIP
mgnify:CR=1